MTSESALQWRPPVPYVALRARARMDQIGVTCPPLVPELLGWLAAHGVEEDGPVFFRYVVVDMAGELAIDVGVPVKVLPAGDDRVRADVLPAGRYAVCTHHGHYQELVGATGGLLDWAQRQGVRWQASPDQRHWAARLEIYHNDPDDEPNPARWETELAFLTEANPAP